MASRFVQCLAAAGLVGAFAVPVSAAPHLGASRAAAAQSNLDKADAAQTPRGESTALIDPSRRKSTALPPSAVVKEPQLAYSDPQRNRRLRA